MVRNIPKRTSLASQRYRSRYDYSSLMFDLTGIARRATVYGWITAFLTIAFAVLDAYTSRYIVTSRTAVLTLIGAAIALALSLHVANQRLTPVLIDSLYKKSRFGRAILERAAAAVAHATNEAAISAALVDWPTEALDLSGAAFYAHRDGAFVKKAATGQLDELPESVVRNDPVVLSLMAEHKPLRLPLLARTPLLDGTAPILAVPVALRSELLGFALYWPRKNGTALDGYDEQSLMPIATNAAIAWQHLCIVGLRARLAAIENAQVSK